MAQMIDLKPSYKGEANVWESLEAYLPNDVVVYNQREINGREYDFCLMIENLGILIIEVKGWNANKIKVHGIDNIEVEGYEKPQNSPKKQARAYRFAILNKLSEKYNVSPLVLDMVCYPFISKEEYKDVHLDIVSEEKFTLFKEDIENREILNCKINQVFASNMLIPHDAFSEDLMCRIRKSQEPKMMVESSLKILPYSMLHIIKGTVDDQFSTYLINNYFAGVKTIVFVDNKDSFNSILETLNKGFKKHNIEKKNNNLCVGYLNGITKNEYTDLYRAFNFEMYYCNSIADLCEATIEIREGNTTEVQKNILNTLSERTSFNFQQYEVEHATTSKDILVEAGAGTGKTFSMVSRIAYLCNKENNPVTNIAEEIAMVTFTNDAAINMKKRLKQMFINYFILTGKENYLRFVEDVDRANISTIHKFAIGIMRAESLYTGLGTNFRITSNEYNRSKVYDLYMERFLEEKEEENPNFLNELPIPVYELKKKLMVIATKLFDKSVNLSVIKKSEMGVSVDNNLPYFNDLLLKVVFPAELTYSEALHSANDVDLKESLIELGKVLFQSNEKIEDLHLRYLFIDEFQDTDDVQIELFQMLQKKINADCKLFVVGDLKQSIYRFRGAKLNAFQKLQNGKEIEWSHHKLNRNYRTDGRLLALYDEIFSRLGNQRLLPYSGADDCLKSSIQTNVSEDNLFVELPCHGKDEEKIMELLFSTIASEKNRIENMMKTQNLSMEERTIAILVRNNWQVEHVVKASLKNDINVEVSTGGDLFQLPSTLDLYKLALAITHSTSSVHLINFIESNYTGFNLEYHKMHAMSEREKVSELSRILDDLFITKMDMKWNELLNEVYTQPVLYSLKRIFDALKPWEIYSSNLEKRRSYIANYEYLLERMINFLRVDTLTLNQVVEYLNINILTGQQQLSRTVEVNDEGVHVICTTVHKSKGLEYGTVILPYTYEDISDVKKSKLEANYNDSKMSYTVLFENGIRERNSNYNEDKEVEEQMAEESRILYVALTRAISNCIWLNNIDVAPHMSWASLLEG